MKTHVAINLRLLRDIILAMVLLSSIFALQASAQVGQGAIGVIEALRQDDGYITISGRNWGYDGEVSEIYLQNEIVDAAILDEGMSVRFTVNAQGIILRLEILGPFSELRLLDQN